jgi:hypothetical protein
VDGAHAPTGASCVAGAARRGWEPADPATSDDAAGGRLQEDLRTPWQLTAGFGDPHLDIRSFDADLATMSARPEAGLARLSAPSITPNGPTSTASPPTVRSRSRSRPSGACPATAARYRYLTAPRSCPHRSPPIDTTRHGGVDRHERPCVAGDLAVATCHFPAVVGSSRTLKWRSTGGAETIRYPGTRSGVFAMSARTVTT